MDEKVRLRVLGISYTQLHSGAYALLLAQENGLYRIPVVIGSQEAQSIAIKMEGIIPPRPITHDLFVSFAHAFGVKLKEVFIYKFEDGIFYSELTFSDGERQIALDARTSDAIAIAMRTHSPIFTTASILQETGFIIENDKSDTVKESSKAKDERRDEMASSMPKLENYAIEELERTLSRLIEEENYEEAARVKSIINKKRKASGEDRLA